MIQKRRKRSKKWLWWVIFVVLLVVAGVVVYLVWDGYFREDKPVKGPEEGATSVVTGADDGKVEKPQDEETVRNEDVEGPVQYEGEDPNLEEGLTGVVTYAGVTDGKLMVRVNIDQYLDSGSCELVLMSANATVYNMAAGIVGSASTASCAGFDVPVSELPSGKLQIIVYLNANGKTGEIKGETNI